MQALKQKWIVIFLLSFVNIYCLTNVVTGGRCCNHFRINISNSLPFYLFSTSALKSIEREMYASISHSLSCRDLFKQIVGLPGDQIAINHDRVFINGCDYGYIHPKSPSGLLLSPISEGIIPEGFVFVHATHPESFDSRYSEFGLVDIVQIKERLWPVF